MDEFKSNPLVKIEDSRKTSYFTKTLVGFFINEKVLAPPSHHYLHNRY